MNAQEALGPWLKRYWGLEIVMSDSHTVQLSDAANPHRYESFGYALAMRVLQSALYEDLDGRERAECDELIYRGMRKPAPSASDNSENEATK